MPRLPHESVGHVDHCHLHKTTAVLSWAFNIKASLIILQPEYGSHTPKMLSGSTRYECIHQQCYIMVRLASPEASKLRGCSGHVHWLKCHSSAGRQRARQIAQSLSRGHHGRDDHGHTVFSLRMSANSSSHTWRSCTLPRSHSRLPSSSSYGCISVICSANSCWKTNGDHWPSMARCLP